METGAYRQLWLNVLEQVKADLCSGEENADRLVLDAAKYIFLVPSREEARETGSFSWICSLLDRNSDVAALGIFEDLTSVEQTRVQRLLASCGFMVDFSVKNRARFRPHPRHRIKARNIS